MTLGWCVCATIEHFGIEDSSSTRARHSLHFRSPLKSADGDHPTKANRVGESFRNRIAINGGPWKVGTRPTNAESECESRSRKWNFVSPCANRDKPALTFIAINYRRQTGGETGTLCTKRDLRFVPFAALWYKQMQVAYGESNIRFDWQQNPKIHKILRPILESNSLQIRITY